MGGGRHADRRCAGPHLVERHAFGTAPSGILVLGRGVPAGNGGGRRRRRRSASAGLGRQRRRGRGRGGDKIDRKSTRLNSSHLVISYAVFCLKKKKQEQDNDRASKKLINVKNVVAQQMY